MFSFDIFEILIVALVAFMVLGPKQTIKTAFVIGGYCKKLKASLNDLKAKLNLEDLNTLDSKLYNFDASLNQSIVNTTNNLKNSILNTENSTLKAPSIKIDKVTVHQDHEDVQRQILKLEQELSYLKEQCLKEQYLKNLEQK